MEDVEEEVGGWFWDKSTLKDNEKINFNRFRKFEKYQK